MRLDYSTFKNYTFLLLCTYCMPARVGNTTLTKFQFDARAEGFAPRGPFQGPVRDYDDAGKYNSAFITTQLQAALIQRNSILCLKMCHGIQAVTSTGPKYQFRLFHTSKSCSKTETIYWNSAGDVIPSSRV